MFFLIRLGPAYGQYPKTKDLSRCKTILFLSKNDTTFKKTQYGALVPVVMHIRPRENPKRFVAEGGFLGDCQYLWPPFSAPPTKFSRTRLVVNHRFDFCSPLFPSAFNSD
jgi:hypothetical protein